MASVASGDLLKLLRNANSMVAEHPAWRVALLVVAGGWAAMLTWVAAAWGAYRALTGLGRSRSAAAFLLFGLLCLPVFAVMFLMASALTR
jgi:hypothetical protein